MVVDLSKANRDVTLLAPFVQKKLSLALAECEELGYQIKVVETYRSPARQDFLYEKGRTQPGKKVTYAKGFMSLHNYALAVDVCFWDGRKYWWPKADDSLWDRVQDVFEKHGFESLKFERAHFQITAGLTISEAFKICKDQGMLALWNVVEMRLKRGSI